MQELIDAGMVRIDNAARLVWLPNALRYNVPANPNVVIGWGPHWLQLPECDLLNAAEAALAAGLKVLDGGNRKDGLLAAFEVATGKRTLADTDLRVGRPVSSRSGTDTPRPQSSPRTGSRKRFRKQEQDPDRDQEHTQEQPPDPDARACVREPASIPAASPPTTSRSPQGIVTSPAVNHEVVAPGLVPTPTRFPSREPAALLPATHTAAPQAVVETAPASLGLVETPLLATPQDEPHPPPGETWLIMADRLASTGSKYAADVANKLRSLTIITLTRPMRATLCEIHKKQAASTHHGPTPPSPDAAWIGEHWMAVRATSPRKLASDAPPDPRHLVGFEAKLRGAIERAGAANRYAPPLREAATAVIAQYLADDEAVPNGHPFPVMVARFGDTYGLPGGPRDMEQRDYRLGTPGKKPPPAPPPRARPAPPAPPARRGPP